jgi:hypothetical protein
MLFYSVSFKYKTNRWIGVRCWLFALFSKTVGEDRKNGEEGVCGGRILILWRRYLS